jgi:hypothetical protein
MSASGTLPASGAALPPAPAPVAPAGKGRRRWPRRLAWPALAVVIVATLGFFGGGGWYFAGQIRSDHRGRHRSPRQARHVGIARRGTATRPPAPRKVP